MNGPPPPRGDSRGYQNDGGPPRPNMGRGGRPAPLERAPNSDPGSEYPPFLRGRSSNADIA
jgi:hypothetical protein